MAPEAWRMDRAELKDLLLKYERAVESDSYNILNPNARERQVMGDALIARRAEAMRKAREANSRFIQAFIDDLPDSRVAYLPPQRPVCAIRCPSPPTATLPASSYGSIASVFLHVMRDWSPSCRHVLETTYDPAVRELQALLPAGGEVLVPGCGLGRLAVGLASAGYRVEANDASRLFLTVADTMLNRPPPASPIFPLAHVFSENWSHDQQYHEVVVPGPAPIELMPASGDVQGSVTLVPGDFMATYGRAGPCHRRFDAIVTCFFLDTVTDFCELVDTLDGMLAEGGIWLNVGPLNFKKEARLKLSWDEIVSVWEGIGYEFVCQKRADCDYHLQRGEKMYTESYLCALTAAVKRTPRP